MLFKYIIDDNIFQVVPIIQTQNNNVQSNKLPLYVKCWCCPNVYTKEEMGYNPKTNEPYTSCSICRNKKNITSRKLYANKTPSEKKELKEKQKIYEAKCKDSQNKLRREWKQRRREKEENRKIDAVKMKEYRKKNIEKFKQKEKKYRDANKEEISKKQKEYKAENREALLERRKQYRLEHREETNARQNELRKIKMDKLKETNPKKKTKQELKAEAKQAELKKNEEEMEKINPHDERNCQRCGRTYTEEEFGINPSTLTYYKNCFNCREAQKISDKKRQDKKKLNNPIDFIQS